MKQSGAKVHLVEYPHLPHGFWLFPIFAERITSRDEVAAFVRGERKEV